MKTTNKLLIALLASIALVITNTYADETATGTTQTGGTLPPKKEMLNEYKNQFKQNIQKQHSDIKANKEAFVNQYGKLNQYSTGITAEVKAQIETLKTTYRSDVDALQTSYKAKIASGSTLEERQSLRDELQTKLQDLSKTYFEKLNALVGDNNAEMQKYIDARKQMFQDNSQIRKDAIDSRKEIKNEKHEMMLKYKEQFANKVGANLEKISKKAPERLDTVLAKIQPLITKYQASTKLTAAQKEKVVSQLQALENLIKEIQSTQNIIDETISE